MIGVGFGLYDFRSRRLTSEPRFDWKPLMEECDDRQRSGENSRAVYEY